MFDGEWVSIREACRRLFISRNMWVYWEKQKQKSPEWIIKYFKHRNDPHDDIFEVANEHQVEVPQDAAEEQIEGSILHFTEGEVTLLKILTWCNSFYPGPFSIKEFDTKFVPYGPELRMRLAAAMYIEVYSDEDEQYKGKGHVSYFGWLALERLKK